MSRLFRVYVDFESQPVLVVVVGGGRRRGRQSVWLDDVQSMREYPALTVADDDGAGDCS